MYNFDFVTRILRQYYFQGISFCHFHFAIEEKSFVFVRKVFILNDFFLFMILL